MKQVFCNILFLPDSLQTSGDFFQDKRDDNLYLSGTLPVLICWSCHKVTTEIYFLMILEARSLIKVSTGLVSLRPLFLDCRYLSSPCVFTWSSFWVCLCPNVLFL